MNIRDIKLSAAVTVLTAVLSPSIPAAGTQTTSFSLNGGGPITWKQGSGHGWVSFGTREKVIAEAWSNAVTTVTTGVVDFAYAYYGQTWNERFATIRQAKQRFTVDLRPYTRTNGYVSARLEWTIRYTPGIGVSELGYLMGGTPVDIAPIPLELGQLQTPANSCDMEPDFMFVTPTGYAGYGAHSPPTWDRPPQVVLVQQTAAIEPRTNGNPGCRTVLEVGDPINALSGNVSVNEDDLRIPGLLPLAISRCYGSTAETAEPLGARWRHNYGWSVWETNVVFGTDTNRWLVLAADDDLHWKALNVANGGHEVEHGLRWRYEQDTNGAYTVLLPRGIRYAFATNGLLQRIADAWGNTQTVVYTNAIGRLLPARVDQNDGRNLVLTYDSSNRLVGVASPSTNLAVTYAYNGVGQLTGAVVRAGACEQRTTYEYGEADTLTRRRNAMGVERGWAYAGFRGTNSWTGTNRWYDTDVDYNLDSINRRTVTIHRDGTTAVWHYDVDPLVRKIAGVYGPNSSNVATWSGTRYTTDEYGKFTQIEQADWRTNVAAYAKTVMQYDEGQRVTNWAHAYMAQPDQFWSIRWNTNWDTVTSVVDPEGRRTERDYTNGVICATRMYPVTNAPVETRYAYTSNGLLAAVTNANGHWVRYQYDGYGYPTSTIPQAGPTNWMLWDNLGRLQELRLPSTEKTTNDPPQMVPRIIAFDRDDLGRVRSVTLPGGGTETFAFDAIDNLTNHTDAAGRSTRYSWLPTGKLASMTRGSGAQEAVTRLEYDQQFNTTRVIDELGRHLETYQFDLQDRPISVSNVDGRVMTVNWGVADVVQSIVRFDGTTNTLAYDTGGRVSQVTYPGGTLTFRYFRNGLLMTASNQWGVISNAVDGANRVTSVATPTPNGTVAYALYPAGQVSNVVSVAGTNSYTLDPAERLVTLTVLTPGIAAASFQYGYNSVNGLVSNVMYPNGLTCAAAYDNLDRLTALVWKNASNQIVQSRTYAHDGVGMVTNVVYETGETVAYAYDALDRLTGERHVNATGQLASEETYGYDLAGNRTNKTVWSGATPLITVGYVLGMGNRLATWSVAETDLVGQVDIAGVSSEVIGTNDRFGWLYVSNLNGTASTKPYSLGTNFWAYDLTVALGTQKVVAAVRDQAGNTTRVTNEVCLTVVTNGALQYNLAGGVTNITYRGRDYTRTLGLTWDNQDQLTTVTTNGTVAERYGYDALGRRIWTWDVTRGTNWHVYNGPHVIADMSAAGLLLRGYTYGPGIDNVLSMTAYGTTTSTYYYIKDHLGSVLALADKDGNLVENYRYDAWGRTTAYDASGNTLAQSAYGNRYCWQGREHSWISGLYYFRARWYSPVEGRWLANDPIGISGGLNQYVAFCANPVSFVDPWGLASKKAPTVAVISGGGVNSLAAGRAGAHMRRAGWSVHEMSVQDFVNNNSQINGIILAGHGSENQAAGIPLQVLQDGLNRTGSRLDVAISLSCHGYDLVSRLHERGLTTPDSLLLGYWGYSMHTPVRQLRIDRAIDKWLANPCFATASYGNLFQDGFGQVWFGIGDLIFGEEE